MQQDRYSLDKARAILDLLTIKALEGNVGFSGIGKAGMQTLRAMINKIYDDGHKDGYQACEDDLANGSAHS